MKKNVFILLIIGLVFSACTRNSGERSEESGNDPKTPVTLTHINIEPIAENIELRATSLFQKKVSVKANATGYIDEVTINIGDEVSVGQLLFTIKTKEASAIENQSSSRDTTLNFSGLLKIKAQKSGIITTLDHQKGDYVQDGEQLAAISERSSLIFVLEVPFELHQYVRVNGDCRIVLPDSQTVRGIISGILPSVDAVSQTQSFVLTPETSLRLPENLIAKVEITRSVKEKGMVIEKSALLTNETQTSFWVMKLINDSTAIKIPVKKGIETSDKVEIIEPRLNTSDKIILTGNYGLADTARVIVEH